MPSFGLLIARLTGVSYFSITSLNQAHERLATLYTQDMVGAIEADKIGLARLSIARQGTAEKRI